MENRERFAAFFCDKIIILVCHLEWRQEWNDFRLNFHFVNRWCSVLHLHPQKKTDHAITSAVLVIFIRIWCLVMLTFWKNKPEFGKMFGIDCRRFLFSPPPSPSLSPLHHFSPIFCSPQACSFARSLFARPLFARLFDLRLERERKRLLRRLQQRWMGSLEWFTQQWQHHHCETRQRKRRCHR